MSKFNSKNNEIILQTPRSSTSTIDSVTAAELVQQYENISKNTPFTISQQQSSSNSPNVNNNISFDKSDGIHFGDVINNYYTSPPSQALNESHHDQKPQMNNPEISVSKQKERKFLTSISQKSNLVVLAVISIIIIVIIGSTLFMMRHKLISIDTTDTTTIKIIESTSTTEVDIDSTTSYLTTTTSYKTTTTTTTEHEATTTENIKPTIPPIITLESYVSREQWNADQPRATVDLDLPIYRIIIAHTATHGCNYEEECTEFVRELQRNSSHLDDIPYNFLIGSDSKVYEGRGFQYEGQHTMNINATEYNSIGICVAFIGNFESEMLSESQVKVFDEFIGYFKDLNVIFENYSIFMQDQLMKTEVEGHGLLETFQTWKGYRKLQKIYHRFEWNADLPKLTEKFTFPMNWSLITSTGGKECNNFLNCSVEVKRIQLEAFDDGLNDIPYGFVIGTDGSIFEGRGWDYAGQHTNDYDSITLAICVIGHYGVKTPSTAMSKATYNLLEDGAALGKLTKDYIVNGRQELKMELTGPGGDFVKIIRTWPHWKFWGMPKGKLFFKL